MKTILIFYPVAALFFLQCFIAFYMFFKRKEAVEKGEVDFRYFKTYDSHFEIPRKVKAIENNYNNLFQLPLFFVGLCAFLAALKKVDETFIILAWLFVVSRYLHSFIHIQINKLALRATCFASGLVINLFIVLRLLYIS